MRKVLSFVLVLSLVLGSFGMAFAATPKASDVKGLACEDAVTVLTDLNVVSGYADGSYKPAGIVTRAEMATLIVKALGLSDYAVGASKFADCKGHWANGYIAYANSLGIISGRTATKFDPDATVSYDEATTMLVKALGYTDDCLLGVYPANYVTKAKSLGMLDGVKSGSIGANRGDIAVMLYQTLDQNIGKVNKDGDWVANGTAYNGKVETPDTMLDRLGAENYNDGKAFVVTDGIAKDESVMNLYPYIGAYVKAYKNSDKDIIAVKEVKSTFLTGEVKANGKFKADGVEYSFEKASFLGATSTSAVIFANGKEGATAGQKTLTTNDGKVTIAVDVSGKTIKEIYSIATWTVNGDGFFSNDDAADIKDGNKLFGAKFVKDNNDKLDMNSFALMGAKSLSDIAKDSVVYIYTSDKEIKRIEVGTEVVTGEVTKVSDGDYTIGGKVYSFAAQNGNDNYVPKPGDTVKIALDYSGDIYECTKNKGGADNYAVVLDVKSGSIGFAGDEAKINLFLKDGTDKTFVADEEEIADAILLETTKGWTSAVTTGAIIKYSVDKNGVIDEIVTTSALRPAGNKAEITKKGYYDGYSINSSVTIFTYDETNGITTKAADYSISSLEKVLDSKDADARYVLKDGKIDVMLLKSDVTAGNDVYAVATGAAENNSDAKHEVTLLTAGTEKTYNAKTAAYNNGLKGNRDALYLVKFNSAGDVSDLTATTGAIKANAPTTHGFTVSGKVVSVTTPAGVTGAALIKDGKITLDKDVVVYVWNVNNGAYEVGSVRDIESAEISVEFFDVFDNDSVYDVVLIHE